MKRKQTISLADDKRARIPFALVAVVLLTTSIGSVSIINQRSTPEVDVSPDLVHERTSLAAESVISGAVSDAIAEAGEQPVTSGSNTPIGTALASGDASSDEIFKRYVKLRIYVKINKRLRDATQTVSGPHGAAQGMASLPPIGDDPQSVTEALDRITLEVGGDGIVPEPETPNSPDDSDWWNRADDSDSSNSDDSEADDNGIGLDRGEYQVTVDEIQYTVSVDGDEIHREQRSHDATGETAVFAMHSQVSDYQEMLDRYLGPKLYSQIYPPLYTKAMFENTLAKPNVAHSFPELIHNQELVVFTNKLNYDMQYSAFGTTDQSYPSMMGAGYQCLSHIYAGQFLDGIAGEGVARYLGGSPKKLIEGTPIVYPGELACYFTMYTETQQATTTAATDLPSVDEFADPDTEWNSSGDLYDDIPSSAETLRNVEFDIKTPDNVTSDQLETIKDANSPNAEQKIEIDPVANQTYIEMFDKSDNFFGRPDGENQQLEEDYDQTTGDLLPEVDDDGDLSVDATEAETEDVNRLRRQLLDDVDPIEVTPIQLLASDDIYGDMIRQIEQNSDEYIYNETYQTRRYGLRNAYLRHVIDSLEAAEKGRRETADRLNQEFGDRTLEESLILGQAALEGEASNPERIEELIDNARRESETEGSDRFDKADRTSYVWWETGHDDPHYRADRYEDLVAGGTVEDTVGGTIPQEFDNNGVPKQVTPDMLFALSDGELPKSDDVITSTSISGADYAGGDGIYPGGLEGDDKDRTWNVRPVDLDKDIYRITNAELINRGWGGDRGSGDTYVQLHKINDDMNLVDGARWYLGQDMYTFTLLDVPEKPDDTSDGVDKDAEELAVPELQPADEEDFEFEIHASPGYLSGLPITREIEPSIRPAGADPRHSRNTLFTPFSSKILNPLPNPGFPIIIPVPPKPIWIASTNYWKTDVKGEYARFELRSETSNGLDTGPENYVRQDMSVKMNINGQSTSVGSVDPISFEASNHFPVMVPGRFINKITPPPKKGSWGTGNSLNAEIFAVTGKKELPWRWKPKTKSKIRDGPRELRDFALSGQGAPVPFVGWQPEQCTPGWPEVGAGVDPQSIGRQCASYGPIGEMLVHKGPRSPSGTAIAELSRGSVIIHASLTGNSPNEQVDQEVNNLCKTDEPCPNVYSRDRND